MPPEITQAADSVSRVVGQAGEIRRHRSGVPIGSGLAGQRARDEDPGHQIEVDHGPRRARCIATELLVPHKMV